MFSNDSILLREYFFPQINLKNSKEFQNLYEHFQSIKRIPVEITSFKESKLKGKVSIDTNFGSQKILKQTYSLKKSTLQFTFGKVICQINVFYDSEDNKRKFLDTVIQLIQFVGSLSTITISKLILNLYLIDEKKNIKENMNELGKEEVNSGSCQRGETTIITIYRIEEIIKVILHELIHAFQYDDFIDNHQIIQHYRKKYNISSDHINTNEAYTEIWANIINCYLISQRVGRDRYNLFLILLSLENAFSTFQAQKVFYLTKLNRKKKININKETNVLSYFIIRNELYGRIVPFLNFCKTNNKDYIKLNKKEKWFDFLKKNKKIEKNNKRFYTIHKNNYLFTTMRMSLNEIMV